MRKIILIIALSASCLVSGNSQGVVEEISNRLDNYIKSYPQEKVFVHTDRDIYSSNQMIWFKAYVLNAATHVPMDLSKVLYVEILNERLKPIAVRKLYIDQGFARGNILLPAGAEGGNYILRAYTKYMLNRGSEFIFRKEITVIDLETPESVLVEEIVTSAQTSETGSNNRIDLRFFPEGGHLVSGPLTVLGVKAVAPDGFGRKISGKIFDENGVGVSNFETNEVGIGKVAVAALPGINYFAQIDGDGFRYELPTTEESGYFLTARIWNGSLTIQAAHNRGVSMEGYSLLLHTSGIPVAFFSGKAGMKSLTTRLSTQDLEKGILTITLFNKQGQALCERLVFIDSGNKAAIDVTTAKSEYGIREKVNLKVDLSGTDSAQLSMSIVRPEYLSNMGEVASIEYYLMLESDIRGYIEDIGRYFDEKNLQREEELDALMLTQGWRRFDWDEVMKEKQEIEYKPEFGLSISGRMVDFYKEEKSVEGVVQLSFLEDLMSDRAVETDPAGNFIFRDLQFADSVTAIIQGSKSTGNKKKNREKDKDDPVKILLSEKQWLSVSRLDSLYKTNPSTVGFKDYQQSTKIINQIYDAYNFDDETIVLDEVAIQGYRDTWKDSPFNRGQMYRTPTRRLVMDSLNIGNQFRVVDMLRRLPGIQIFGTFPDYQIVIRSAASFQVDASPLILVDNVQVDIPYLATMDGTTVEFIDILSTSQASMYGALAYGGVIAIYTNVTSSGGRGGSNAQQERLDWGISTFELIGYQIPDAFYAPRYDERLEEHNKPDFRSVLHWEPTIMVRNGNPTEFNFYTSDESANYLLITQGISYSGKPLLSVKSITVGKEE